MAVEAAQPKIPTEDLHLKSVVHQFILSLVKTLQETSHYTPDHPEVKRYIAALFQQLQALVRGKSEVTFLAKVGGDPKEVLLDGIFPEVVNLATLLPQAVGDLFLPKFREYFDRHRLLAWSIKADIPQPEFEVFIAVMSAFAAPGNTTTNVAAETAKLLAARGVSHASLVFMEELVGRDRHLPWRVEVALTRLRKDLRTLPLFKSRDATEIRRAKAQVIDDIIQRLPPAIVGHTALELAKELEAVAPTGGTPHQERARDLLKVVVARLHDQAIPGADQVLSHLFEHRLLTLADLPQRLQEAIATKQFADEYLAHEPQHVERLCALRDNPTAAAPYARIVPEPLRREKYTSALTVMRGIESTASLPHPVRALPNGIHGIAPEGGGSPGRPGEAWDSPTYRGTGGRGGSRASSAPGRCPETDRFAGPLGDSTGSRKTWRHPPRRPRPPDGAGPDRGCGGVPYRPPDPAPP
jgi:hypothetical protein